MSISVPIEQREARKIGRLLAKHDALICLDPLTYVKALLIAKDRLMRGREVNAQIVKGFQDAKEASHV